MKESKNVDQSYMGSSPLSYTTPSTVVASSFRSMPLLLLFLVVQPYTVMPSHTVLPDAMSCGATPRRGVLRCVVDIFHVSTPALRFHVF